MQYNYETELTYTCTLIIHIRKSYLYSNSFARSRLRQQALTCKPWHVTVRVQQNCISYKEKRRQKRPILKHATVIARLCLAPSPLRIIWEVQTDAAPFHILAMVHEKLVHRLGVSEVNKTTAFESICVAIVQPVDFAYLCATFLRQFFEVFGVRIVRHIANK